MLLLFLMHKSDPNFKYGIYRDQNTKVVIIYCEIFDFICFYAQYIDYYVSEALLKYQGKATHLFIIDILNCFSKIKNK